MGYFCKKKSKYFRDMGIQSFLNLGVILLIFANLFLGIYWILSKIFKGIRDTGDPLPGPHS